MDTLTKILDYQFLDIPLWSFVGAFGALLGGFVLKRVFALVISRLLRVAARTRFVFDTILLTAVEKPIGWAAILAGVWVMSVLLPLPDSLADVQKFVAVLLKGVSIALVIWIATRLTDGLCGWWSGIAKKTETKLDDQIVPIVRRTGKLFLIIIGALLVMQNLGYSVGSLLAGLGIGGMAMALASKDTVANVFGSLVIFLDQPFQVGDWIEVGSLEGTVEEVGLRTTLVRTFANSLISVPNHMFTTTAVNNWSRMKKRRIKMVVGLTYGTTAQQMSRAVERIRRIIKEDERFDHSFFLVYFDAFASSSLNIFVYCFTITTNWAEFLAVKQDFLLEIMRAMQQMGLDFAFPTQTVHIESMPGEPGAMSGERPS